MKLIIVGGGIMGLSAAWAARRAGHEVTLIEQGPLPNPLASSFDQHRLIRYTYGAREGYARMVALAYAAWERLWGDLGAQHYVETGTLAVARDSAAWVEASVGCLERLGVAQERWAPGRIREHLPFLELDDGDWALFTPTGGVLFAERILQGLAGWLGSNGATLLENRPVEAIDPIDARVRLADGEVLAADALVVAAGPWTPRLLPALGERVTPSRQVLVYLDPPAEHRRAWEAAPALLDQVEAAEGGFYAVPPVGGTGFKLGDHAFSLQGQPDREREPTPADVEATLALAADRIREFERYRIIDARTCFYSVTAGERFIAEAVGQTILLAGFSGHGFKFGAAIGEAAIEALDGRREAGALTSWAAGEM
jgi:glycine/D-amino acid oxidase-like deaminating enzyme